MPTIRWCRSDLLIHSGVLDRPEPDLLRMVVGGTSEVMLFQLKQGIKLATCDLPVDTRNELKHQVRVVPLHI